MCQSQIQAYTCWVNTQLKKKHGRQCINDLVHDMQDGTAFADLIEVIGEHVFDMASIVFGSVLCRPKMIFLQLQNLCCLYYFLLFCLLLIFCLKVMNFLILNLMSG